MPRGVDRKVPAPEQEMAKSKNDDLCVVCFREIVIFSVGECDHAVCFECSVRMRCLCLQNECPICRKELSKVIFVQPENLQLDSYQQLDNKVRSGLFDKKYRICFASHKEQAAFYDLLCHKCSKCDSVPSTFNLLKDHVRKEHEMFFCDICTDNLKIFSSERKCYNRQQLSIHRRKGDADDSSMRGHPLCKFCDFRFLDRDELFRHLRREHFFCHFCDADGANQFYPDYPSLRDHFRADHYLCEEGECEREQFTAAFRTDIDLKAHRMKVHGNAMGKTAYKQTRTLELEFTLAPRNRNNFHGESSRGTGAIGRSSRRHHDTQMELENLSVEDTSNQNVPPPKIDARNEQDFPSLSGATSTFQANLSGLRDISTYVGHSKLKNTTENFPALSKSSDTTKEADKGGGTKQAYSKMAATKKPNPGPSTSRQGMIIHVSNRPQTAKADTVKKTEEFPALGVSNKNKDLLYSDMSLGHSSVKVSAMPSKYSDLVVNTYESVDPSNFAKVTLIKQTTNKEPKQKPQKPVVPKLDLADNFPTLSKSETSASTPSWVRAAAKNNQTRENKGKVAPAPDLSETEKNKKANQKKPNQPEKEKDKKKNAASKREVPNKTSSSNDENRKNVKNRDNETAEQSRNGASSDKNKQITPSPPPGFNKGPPPGFTGVTLNSVARNENSLTFTSSLGEKFDIHPQNKSVYHAPADMQKRNQALVRCFQKVLKNEAALEQFRTISQLFRESKYSPSAYYEHVKIALGDEFSTIFPELIALLPDINKQKELFLEHSQQTKNHTKDKRKLQICSTCGQILVNCDFAAHSATHILDNNFPELAGKGKTNCTIPVSKSKML